MSKICVIGFVYGGLVTGTCFAELGHQVTCHSTNPARNNGLLQGQMPIYEPGLEQLVEQNVQAKRLHLAQVYRSALEGAEYAFIAIGTPSCVDGEAGLQYVIAAAESSPI
jgi:UDPglucose 6-dehydrogenase